MPSVLFHGALPEIMIWGIANPTKRPKRLHKCTLLRPVTSIVMNERIVSPESLVHFGETGSMLPSSDDLLHPVKFLTLQMRPKCQIHSNMNVNLNTMKYIDRVVLSGTNIGNAGCYFKE